MPTTPRTNKINSRIAMRKDFRLVCCLDVDVTRSELLSSSSLSSMREPGKCEESNPDRGSFSPLVIAGEVSSGRSIVLCFSSFNDACPSALLMRWSLSSSSRTVFHQRGTFCFTEQWNAVPFRKNGPRLSILCPTERVIPARAACRGLRLRHFCHGAHWTCSSEAERFRAGAGSPSPILVQSDLETPGLKANCSLLS